MSGAGRRGGRGGTCGIPDTGSGRARATRGGEWPPAGDRDEVAGRVERARHPGGCRRGCSASATQARAGGARAPQRRREAARWPRRCKRSRRDPAGGARGCEQPSSTASEGSFSSSSRSEPSDLDSAAAPKSSQSCAQTRAAEGWSSGVTTVIDPPAASCSSTRPSHRLESGGQVGRASASRSPEPFRPSSSRAATSSCGHQALIGRQTARALGIGTGGRVRRQTADVNGGARSGPRAAVGGAVATVGPGLQDSDRTGRRPTPASRSSGAAPWRAVLRHRGNASKAEPPRSVRRAAL